MHDITSYEDFARPSFCILKVNLSCFVLTFQIDIVNLCVLIIWFNRIIRLISYFKSFYLCPKYTFTFECTLDILSSIFPPSSSIPHIISNLWSEMWHQELHFLCFTMISLLFPLEHSAIPLTCIKL